MTAGGEGVVRAMALEEAEEKAFVGEERDSECWNPWLIAEDECR